MTTRACVSLLNENSEQHNMASFQQAEVTGIITKVNFAQGRGEPTTFKIHCPNIGKTYDAVCSLFCPIRQGDTIYALCSIGVDGRLHITRQPFVQPPIDRENTIQCFMRALKIGFGPAAKIYQTIARNAGSNDSVITYLSEIAQAWEDSRNNEILHMLNGIEPEEVQKLLGWWHRERNMRRLYLFGLNKKEINACRMTCEEIFNRIMANPFTLPAIPIEKCSYILDQLNKPVAAPEKQRGEIIRFIWKSLHQNGWSGVPTGILARQFPGIKEHVPTLREQYDFVAEMETAYLKFPHKVETFMCKYLADKRKEDLIEYDTPLDQEVQVKGETVVRRSAHFTRSMSDDQAKAVQGALDHSLCVITGGAGTGKCHVADTPIVMYDGTVKMVQDIKYGDLLMGPDSLPRTARETCMGYDDLFQVIPSHGDAFGCNAPHILTLRKGSEVIDVAICKYLKDPSKYEGFRLFRVAIDFPQHKVPIEPYLIGYWIGVLKNPISGEVYDMIHKSHSNYHLVSSWSQHIPQEYKSNSRTTRLHVLAGLIDKSGHIGSEGITVVVPSMTVATDVKFLANSLGYLATIKQDTAIEILLEGVELHEIPYANRNVVPRDKPEVVDVTFEVKPIGQGLYYGFQLDKDGRYLLGDFLVTHNTTCIGQLIHNLEIRGTTYAICSFTGKAVARLREVTKKRNSATMHRLIANAKKNQLDKKSTQFEKDIPFSQYEHIIIDEVSMVTSELMYDFLNAYRDIAHITLVGDVNQLPPIGWGSLMQEIMKSETIPTYRLTTNYRVYIADKERDGVIMNANAIINHNSDYPFQFCPTSNFSLVEGSVERVYDIVRACFNSGIKAEKIVVITPYNRCLENLNKTFQKIYDTGQKSVTDTRGVKWMVGDRVMLTENDNEIGVFNGENGIITEIKDTEIMVDFAQSGCHGFLIEPTPGRSFVKYGQADGYNYRGKAAETVTQDDQGDSSDERSVMKLLHSYALTVDKSQGSEWDFVIFYIPEFNMGSFLNKNRIYTAITRTKRCCWCVVSDLDAFNMAATKRATYRCDNLARRLKDALPNLKPCQMEVKPELLPLNMDNKLMITNGDDPQPDFGEWDE
jgi:hypothetical protein